MKKGEKMRVLIVEDEIPLAEALGQILRKIIIPLI